ncbi:MAG: hypothetical protein IPG18_08170 [Saprospiraceae bacterium]|nr:hypothetical protein [Saprospiraceae bacterium]MBK6565163.1 hypothetical protein [Saprospiraceae bacterium]MBK7523729.1 hypothetical protein [Saprospiraceae bacterium]MBK8373244.1 hypothetical protein [Saprospiraceae bacterium]MBK8852512.1 hypothetical protein [Saprospiraceae bacterium]
MDKKSVLETIDFEFGIWIALNILGLNEINIQPLRGCEIWYVLSPGFTRSYQYSSLSGLGNIVSKELKHRDDICVSGLGNIVNEEPQHRDDICLSGLKI